MFTKLKALYASFQAGSVIANPEAWKRGQITTTYLIAFLSSLVTAAKAFGYTLPVSDDQLAAIATTILFIFGLFNHTATVASTDKISFSGRDNPTSVSEASPGTQRSSSNSSELSGVQSSTGSNEGMQSEGLAQAIRDSNAS